MPPGEGEFVHRPAGRAATLGTPRSPPRVTEFASGRSREEWRDCSGCRPSLLCNLRQLRDASPSSIRSRSLSGRNAADRFRPVLGIKNHSIQLLEVPGRHRAARISVAAVRPLRLPSGQSPGLATHGAMCTPVNSLAHQISSVKDLSNEWLDCRTSILWLAREFTTLDDFVD